jgi:tetratricopeptide (TPR) repeat protein
MRPTRATLRTSHNKLARPAAAAADFTAAIELDRTDPRFWYNRGLAYVRLARPADAVPDLSKAIELNPKDARSWSMRGVAHGPLGQFDRAIADFTECLDRNPKDARARYNRGFAYFQAGRFEKAVADGTEAASLQPKVGDYWQLLAMAHYRVNDWMAAVAAAEKSRELRQGGDGIDCLYLAMAHQKLGHHDQARRAYEQALRWLERNKNALAKDKFLVDHYRRLRAEAEELIGPTKE